MVGVNLGGDSSKLLVSNLINAGGQSVVLNLDILEQASESVMNHLNINYLI